MALGPLKTALQLAQGSEDGRDCPAIPLCGAGVLLVGRRVGLEALSRIKVTGNVGDAVPMLLTVSPMASLIP
jgi:hypothetical protein